MLELANDSLSVQINDDTLSYITLSLGGSFMPAIHGCTTAIQDWEKLRELYTGKITMIWLKNDIFRKENNILTSLRKRIPCIPNLNWKKGEIVIFAISRSSEKWFQHWLKFSSSKYGKIACWCYVIEHSIISEFLSLISDRNCNKSWSRSRKIGRLLIEKSVSKLRLFLNMEIWKWRRILQIKIKKYVRPFRQTYLPFFSKKMSELGPFHLPF